jgi:tetratricopeptide (TPR) repeat protein
MFKNALTQDVAYSTLLQERRKVLHGIIGNAIAKLYAERLPEQYEVLAYHYFEGEIWEKALDYLLKSAHKSAAAFANQDALTYFDKALQAHKRMENAPREMLIEIYSSKAEIYFALSEYLKSVDSYNLLREVARSIENRSLEGLALAGAGIGYVWGHEFVKGESMAREALTIAEEDKDDGVKTAGIYVLNFLDGMRGNLTDAMNKASEVIHLSQITNQPFYESFGYIWKTINYSWRGQFELSHKFAQEGTKVAERYDLGFPLVNARWCDALALAGHGRYNEAITLLNESNGLCARMGEKVNQSKQWNTLGWVYNDLCDWERANECNQKGLDLALSIRDPEIIINAQINLADSSFGIGDRDKAHKMLEELYASLPQQHEWMKWRYTQHLTHSLGEVLLAEGDENRALKLADEGLALAEPTESLKNIVKSRRLRGQVFLAQGKLKEAEKEFLKALNIAEQIGNPPQLWKTFVTLGDLRIAQKNNDKALQAYRNALSVIEDVAAGLNDKSLKDTFLKSGHVKSIAGKAKK